MFEVSTLNVDKFVHTFIQNLRIESSTWRNHNKITFIKYVDRACRIKQQLLYTAEKIRDIPQNLDFSNEKSVQYFIEKHTTLFDKLTSLSNTQILSSYLKNINTKILQKVRIRRKNIENIRKMETKILNKKVRTNLRNKLSGLKKNLSPALCGEKPINSQTYQSSKYRKSPVLENSNTFDHVTIELSNYKSVNIIRAEYDNQKDFFKYSLSENLAQVARKEVEMAEEFLCFHAKDIEYIERKVHVTLYIAKTENCGGNMQNQMKYNQLLCHHAILCLIEPSEKAFVLVENDLLDVIKKYLLQGYKYHFEFQRNPQNSFAALLVLSQWAKVLVKHLNTTMMNTICGILRCDVHEVLVLHGP
ncbi:hypothetical protein WN55_10723 [Dufourea novaeangliae]|uniref:Uncharacterized protein n=1 Tax=Dufourea novaeangliae TaxID=178035 RepID=A0A154PA39_DUFNO|nr:hypothetical protein WN55_10723 [Dufourea novaeangliae]